MVLGDPLSLRHGLKYCRRNGCLAVLYAPGPDLVAYRTSNVVWGTYGYSGDDLQTHRRGAMVLGDPLSLRHAVKYSRRNGFLAVLYAPGPDLVAYRTSHVV
jgi:hypothetical protein